MSPARVLAQSRVRHVHHTSSVARWQAAPHNEPFSATEASAEQRQEHFEHMLDALWRRASAIAGDCTRWNQVLQEKEREAAELANMIRHLFAEYVGPQNPIVTLPAEPAADDATELRPSAANLPGIRHDPSHEVDSELPVQSLPLQNASPVPYAQVRAPGPESTEVADTDVYSPAQTQRADIYEGGALDSFRVSEESRSVPGMEQQEQILDPGGWCLGQEPRDTEPEPIGCGKSVPQASEQEFLELEDGQEGELFAKVRAALSRIVGSDAADAVQDAATTVIPPGWEEKLLISVDPSHLEEKDLPPPESALWPTAHQHGTSPSTASIGDSTMTAELDPSYKSAGVCPTEADHAAALSPEHSVAVPEEVAQSSLFSECLGASLVENMAGALPGNSAPQPLHGSGIMSWEALDLPELMTDDVAPEIDMPAMSPELPPEAVGRVAHSAHQKCSGGLSNSQNKGRGERSRLSHASPSHSSLAPLRKKAPESRGPAPAVQPRRSQGSQGSTSPPQASPKRAGSPSAPLGTAPT